MAENERLLHAAQGLAGGGAEAADLETVREAHPADIAHALQQLEPVERSAVFRALGRDQAGDVLSELDDHVLLELIRGLEDVELSRILEQMPSEHAADVVDELPTEQAEKILDLMEEQKSEEVQGILEYPEQSAGRLMSPDFVALPETATVESAIQHLRKSVTQERAFELFVVDDHQHLVGVVPLRRLLIADPRTPLAALLDEGVVSVRPEMDREDVARLVAKYDLVSMPVVDERNRLVGAITVDDASSCTMSMTSSTVMAPTSRFRSSTTGMLTRSYLATSRATSSRSISGLTLTTPSSSRAASGVRGSAMRSRRSGTTPTKCWWSSTTNNSKARSWVTDLRRCWIADSTVAVSGSATKSGDMRRPADCSGYSRMPWTSSDFCSSMRSRIFSACSVGSSSTTSAACSDGICSRMRESSTSSSPRISSSRTWSSSSESTSPAWSRPSARNTALRSAGSSCCSAWAMSAGCASRTVSRSAASAPPPARPWAACRRRSFSAMGQPLRVDQTRADARRSRATTGRWSEATRASRLRCTRKPSAARLRSQ